MSSNRTNGTKPAIQHTKSILNDRRIRLLLAIVGAIVAWMGVTIVVQPGTTRTINNVPVDFTYDSAAYTSRGLSIVSAPEKYVSLKLSGDGYTIGSLTPLISWSTRTGPACGTAAKRPCTCRCGA